MPTSPSEQRSTAPPLSRLEATTTATSTGGASSAKQPLPEAARRALAEAAARRLEPAHAKDNPEKAQGVNETGGRGGLDPTRYGDWEINGLASDF